MGNHTVGAAMVKTAVALWENPLHPPPLEILDIACEPYLNTDAEFDDEPYHDRPFGQLLYLAFGLGDAYEPDKDTDGEWWFENIYMPFRKRYNLW